MEKTENTKSWSTAQILKLGFLNTAVLLVWIFSNSLRIRKYMKCSTQLLERMWDYVTFAVLYLPNGADGPMPRVAGYCVHSFL